MKEERILILNMVNDGKITAEDAAKLLDALQKGHDPGHGPGHHRHPHHEFWEDRAEDAAEKLNRFSQSIDSFAKDFGDKMGAAFKDMEPKLRKTAKVILEKTATVVDDLSKSLNESIRNMEEKNCPEACAEHENHDDQPKEN